MGSVAIDIPSGGTTSIGVMGGRQRRGHSALRQSLASSRERLAIEDAGQIDSMRLLRDVLPPLSVAALISLVPGYLIAANGDLWNRVPGLLVLVPALIGMRGNVFGSLASRLSTELQTAKHNRNTMARLLTFLDQYIMVEVLLLSAALAVMSRVFHGDAVNLHDVMFNSLVNGVISGSLMLIATKFVVASAVWLHIDPDNVAPIVVTSLGDTITIPTILVICNLLLDYSNYFAQSVIMLLITALAIGGTVRLWRREAKFAPMLAQRLPVLLCCMLASFFSGLVMERLLSTEERVSNFLVLVPLMNSQGGSVGSCVSSRLSTRQQRAVQRGRDVDDDADGSDELGDSPSLSHDYFDVLQQTIVLIAAVSVVLSCVALLFFAHLFSSWTHMLVVMFTMAVVLTVTSTAIALLAIEFSARFGLHPANVTIPIVCAVMDAVASIAFFVLIS
jgi:mgtE-like transporter